MESSESYYDDTYDYDFSPYDYDSWPEPSSSPISDDEPQSHQPHQPDQIQPTAPPPSLSEVVVPDPSVAICNSIDQSKQLIQTNFGIHPSSLRSSNLSGIAIIPLKDLNLIRKDNRFNRNLPNIIVLPTGDDFHLVHPDFAFAVQTLNKQSANPLIHFFYGS